jgi:multiple sugar transport system substrate-binding protein
MMLIYNKGLFRAAGLDPEKAPDTWEQVATFSKQIKEKTGKFGYGMVARLNHGNTPFRIVPVMWGYGGSIFDELDPAPKNKEIRINGEGTVKALELYHRMYATDKSVSPTALTDAQPEVSTQFLNGQVAMIIAHANDASDAKRKNPDLNVGAGLMPRGPARRAAVLGGFQLGLLKTSKNPVAAKALMKAFMDPEWLPQILGDNSNPGTKEALQGKAQAERERRNPFHKPYKEMLAYGVVQPQVAQLAPIWNEVIPTMLQETLTGKKSAKQAADDSAKAVANIMKG